MRVDFNQLIVFYFKYIFLDLLKDTYSRMTLGSPLMIWYHMTSVWGCFVLINNMYTKCEFILDFQFYFRACFCLGILSVALGFVYF